MGPIMSRSMKKTEAKISCATVPKDCSRGFFTSGFSRQKKTLKALEELTSLTISNSNFSANSTPYMNIFKDINQGPMGKMFYLK
jgi:hypothetical protein